MHPIFQMTAITIAIGSALPMQAAVILADPADAEATRQGNGSFTVDRLTDGVLRIGSSGTATKAAVLPFELPTLAPGETITSANLLVNNLGASGTPSNAYNADLYGLGFRSSAAVLASDFYAGPTPDPTDATLLQADFLTFGASGGSEDVETNAAADATLLDYLNAQYANGAEGGDFVFFRLNPDVATTPNNFERYQIAAEENNTFSPAELTIETVVPEPGTMALVGVAGLLALGRRRR